MPLIKKMITSMMTKAMPAIAIMRPLPKVKRYNVDKQARFQAESDAWTSPPFASAAHSSFCRLRIRARSKRRANSMPT
jgi:hypothetical protein